MKVLIFGATGMLGHTLCRMFADFGYEVFGTVRDERSEALLSNYSKIYQDVHIVSSVDVLNLSSLERTIAEFRPDVVVNCVGIVKQLPQAKNRSISVLINSYLPHFLSEVTGSVGARLLHISTDCVFAGDKGPYVEDSFSDARDVYGKSKFLGETDELATNALTLRTSIVGREIREPRTSLFEWLFSQSGKVKGFQRALYSGLTTYELANVIRMILEEHSDMHGLYHVAGPEISKFALLNIVKDIYNIDIELVADNDFFCDRRLDMSKFVAKTGYSVPSWEAMITSMRSFDSIYH